jgi:carbamate kinase
MKAVKITARSIVDLIEDGNEVVITHGNGPQVGMINNAMAALSREDPDQPNTPLSVCVAMSQAYIGYDLQNAMREELKNRGLEIPVTTMITQVRVDALDPAFAHPNKPIGHFMTKEQAEHAAKEYGYIMAEDAGRGYRRMVASPKPCEIVEIEAIRTLVGAGDVVIACGGGGIPVIQQGHVLKGASAVIEKDAIAGKLAADLKTDKLIILTSVPYVYKDFETPEEEPIKWMNVETAREYIEAGEFGEVDMLPKIEAAIEFLEANHEGSVLITSLGSVEDALKGKVGTHITYA